jgi:hypothetical protein
MDRAVKVIEPGHIYELEQLDGDGKPLRLVFVNREDRPHEGTQIQEVIRMIVDMVDCLNDRVNHCDGCLRWEGNDRILKHFTEAQRQMRLALLEFEHRAAERKMDKHGFRPELVPMAADGHFVVPADGPSVEERRAFWADMDAKKKP